MSSRSLAPGFSPATSEDFRAESASEVAEAAAEAAAGVAGATGEDLEEAGYYGFAGITVTTFDDYGFMSDWDFSSSPILTYDYIFDHLAEGTVGIAYYDFGDSEVCEGCKIYHTVFEHDEPTFSSAEEDTGTFTFDVSMATEEEKALKALYAPSTDDFETIFNSLVAEIAEEVSLATADAAHTFKNVKNPGFNDEMFDAFEVEEGAETVSVSTTYTY
tara:strand:- start:37 stop:687 length:651 start_codon:yes stop_codon:yes gene_type:complete